MELIYRFRSSQSTSNDDTDFVNILDVLYLSHTREPAALHFMFMHKANGKRISESCPTSAFDAPQLSGARHR